MSVSPWTVRFASFTRRWVRVSTTNSEYGECAAFSISTCTSSDVMLVTLGSATVASEYFDASAPRQPSRFFHAATPTLASRSTTATATPMKTPIAPLPSPPPTLPSVSSCC